MLEIKNLSVSIQGKLILKGIDLTILKNKTHAIMGPNGSGKSTLAKILSGDSECKIEEGEILYEGQDLAKLSPEERVQKGLFVAFQYPLEIPGVNNFQFLLAVYNTKRKAKKEKPLSEKEFRPVLLEEMKKMDIEETFLKRNINEGFSGGEKKRNEILQMVLLDPALAILDEVDSGLDIDSLKKVASMINEFKRKDKTLVLITHYQRLLNYVEPDFVHVIMEGRIVKTADAAFAKKLEEEGYEKFYPLKGETP